jgi:hypothetical protein
MSTTDVKAITFQGNEETIIILLTTILMTVMFTSCDVIKRKKQNLSDKVISKFDPVNPGTRFNKKRFKEFFGFEPTTDVREDWDRCLLLLSFKCNKQTRERIRSDLKLTHDSIGKSVNGFNIDYPWWDKERIETINPLSRQDDELFWYLWYDKENGRVFFLTFDV